MIGDPRLPARFWAKVSPEPTSGCWLWTGYCDPEGYGRFALSGKASRAYRVAFQALVAPVESGLDLDHLCRVKSCVNPGHLEPVSHAENVRRGALGVTSRTRYEAMSRCLRGHLREGENVRLRRGSDGVVRRICVACQKFHNQKWRAGH